MIQEKKCSKCGDIKGINDFFKNKNTNDGFRNDCKICNRLQVLEYRRTKQGLITQIYSNQKSHSKDNGYDIPSYSLNDLKIWVFEQDLFHILYKEWVNSNYDRLLSPSVDRKDDYKGYSLYNIQLMTFNKNQSKSHKQRKLGISKSGKQCMPVIGTNMETGLEIEFTSIADAIRQGYGNSHIGDVCNGKAKHCKGYYWKFKTVEKTNPNELYIKAKAYINFNN